MTIEANGRTYEVFRDGESLFLRGKRGGLFILAEYRDAKLRPTGVHCALGRGGSSGHLSGVVFGVDGDTVTVLDRATEKATRERTLAEAMATPTPTSAGRLVRGDVVEVPDTKRRAVVVSRRTSIEGSRYVCSVRLKDEETGEVSYRVFWREEKLLVVCPAR